MSHPHDRQQILTCVKQLDTSQKLHPELLHLVYENCALRQYDRPRCDRSGLVDRRTVRFVHRNVRHSLSGSDFSERCGPFNTSMNASGLTSLNS